MFILSFGLHSTYRTSIYQDIWQILSVSFILLQIHYFSIEFRHFTLKTVMYHCLLKRICIHKGQNMILQVTKGFLQQCLDYPRPYLQSTRDVLSKPGGQLVSCLAGHKSELDCIDMTADGRLVVTGQSVLFNGIETLAREAAMSVIKTCFRTFQKL